MLGIKKCLKHEVPRMLINDGAAWGGCARL